MTLNPKQRRFCEEYIKDHNGTQAAIRSGYSKKTAQEQSSRLLSNVMIKEYIQSLEQPIKDQCLVDAATLREGLKIVMERCLQKKAKIEYDHIDKMMKPKLDDETGEPLFEFDANGAIRAIEQLGKHIGFYEKDNKQTGTGELAEVLREFFG
jgi:phage terminase small subunit